MASHQPPTSSIWAKPYFFLRLGLSQLRALVTFTAVALPNKLLHGVPMKRSLVSCMVYSQGKYVSMYEGRQLTPPTGEQIQAYCKSAGVKDHVEFLQCEADTPPANLHYLNCKPGDTGNVLLYFHGGGYALPIIGPGHTALVLDVGRAASIPNVILLEYTLSPALKYPGQMVQAISALRHLLKTHRPSEIIIGGDSAGGQLTLAILSHIMKPSPYAESLTLGEGDNQKLRGALIISPWVTFDTTALSYKSNAKNDFLPLAGVQEFTELCAPKRGEVYAEPLDAPSSFWQTLPVSKTLLTTGSWELFDDDIRKLAYRMGARDVGEEAPVELAVAEKGCHIEPVIDLLMGIPKENSVGLQQILDWSRRLQ